MSPARKKQRAVYAYEVERLLGRYIDVPLTELTPKFFPQGFGRGSYKKRIKRKPRPPSTPFSENS
jgi:hypothetical protein